MHTHRHYFALLLPFFQILCLLGWSLQPVFANSQCSFPDIKSGDKIALVIANSYNQTLKHPVNDAQAMHKVLTELGFRVIVETELNRKTMNQATIDFTNCLRTSKGVGLFYFTGHGIQVKVNGNGRDDFLLPIETSIEDETDVEYEAFEVKKILDRLEKIDNELNIIILDACYDNSSGRSLPNLCHQFISSTPSNFLIAYPTSERKTVKADLDEKNSVYIRHLTHFLIKTKPGERIVDVFGQVSKAVEEETNKKQIPRHISLLVKPFCPRGKCKPDVEPPKEEVTLTVSGNVDGATIFIYEKREGILKKKYDKKLQPGRRYLVQIEKSGYFPYETSIDAEEHSKTQQIDVNLKPIAKLMPSVGF